MSDLDELAQLDAELFLAVNEAFVLFPQNVDQVLKKVVPLTDLNALTFVSNINLLRSIIYSVSPVNAPLLTISKYAQELSSIPTKSNVPAISKQELAEDLRSLLTWLSDGLGVKCPVASSSLIKTANDLESDFKSRSDDLGFARSIDNYESSEELHAYFIMSEVKELAKYHADLSQLLPLYESSNQNSQLSSWVQGIMIPYITYFNKFAALTNKHDPAFLFLSMDSYWDQFQVLVEPLSSENLAKHSHLSLDSYLDSVILPFAMYNSADLGPLVRWLFAEHSFVSIISKFSSYLACIKSVFDYKSRSGESFGIDTVHDLVRHFIASCYYFTFYEEESVPSIEVTKVYDIIKATCELLKDKFSPVPDESSLIKGSNLNPPEVSSFSEFYNMLDNSLGPLFRSDISDIVSFLHQSITVSAALYPVCDLTIAKYISLQKSQGADVNGARKEVSRIMLHAEGSNVAKVLDAVKIFSTSFFLKSTSATTEISRVVFERLLMKNLFNEAILYYRELVAFTPSEAFDITLEKFWAFFEVSQSFNEKAGELKNATDCLMVMDVLQSEPDLDDTRKHKLIKLRHLLKGINNVRNFKLKLSKSESTTPRFLLEKLSKSEADNKFTPLSLVSLLLEQNPKSYLAHEKLYKITSDLAIFLDIDLDTLPFAKVQAICIEAALIDNNFDYAYKRSKDLFEDFMKHKKLDSLNDYWLTFYQVCKYVLPEWFNDDNNALDNKRIEVLLKQRELLSLTLKLVTRSSSSVDNSRLILAQIKHIQALIDSWYENADSVSTDISASMNTERTSVGDTTSSMIKEGQHASAQASEKLSNLFVSGLGWAIGANRN